MWFGHGFGWTGMLLGGLFMLLLWGGIFALIFWAVKSFAAGAPRSGGQFGPTEPSAREILDRRYASGELSRDEYELMKADLNN